MALVRYFFGGAEKVLESSTDWQFVDGLLDERFSAATIPSNTPRFYFNPPWMMAHLAPFLVSSGWTIWPHPEYYGTLRASQLTPQISKGTSVLEIVALDGGVILAALTRLRVMARMSTMRNAPVMTDGIMIVVDNGHADHEIETRLLGAAEESRVVLEGAFKCSTAIPLLVLHVTLPRSSSEAQVSATARRGTSRKPRRASGTRASK